MTDHDHAQAALEGYAPVFDAREQWLASGSDADKALFDAADREYRSRFDCSCPTDGPRVCSCTFQPAPHTDASDTINVYRSDSGATTMPKSPTFKSDVTDDAEQAMRSRNLTAWCAPLAATKENARDGQHRAALVGERIARANAAEAERKQMRAGSVRMDAKMPAAKCACGTELTADDHELSVDQCAKCRADSAERTMKTRGSRGPMPDPPKSAA